MHHCLLWRFCYVNQQASRYSLVRLQKKWQRGIVRPPVDHRRYTTTASVCMLLERENHLVSKADGEDAYAGSQCILHRSNELRCRCPGYTSQCCLQCKPVLMIRNSSQALRFLLWGFALLTRVILTGNGSLGVLSLKCTLHPGLR